MTANTADLDASKRHERRATMADARRAAKSRRKRRPSPADNTAASEDADAIEDDIPDRPQPAAWRIADWLREVPISRGMFYLEKKRGKIRTAKAGSAVLVVTSPRQYISSLNAA
jgi:hypothetical protein